MTALEDYCEKTYYDLDDKEKVEIRKKLDSAIKKDKMDEI